jgi:hypothetical protein
MRYRLLFGMLVPAAATVSAFAGCDTLGNGCNTNCCGTNPRPLQPAPPQLLYPIPGATGVPTAAGSLVFSGTPAPGLTAELLGGATPVALFIAPPPSPRATPSAGATSAPPAVAAYPALAAGTTYTVVFNVTPPVVCGISQYDDGSFTTK